MQHSLPEIYLKQADNTNFSFNLRFLLVRAKAYSNYNDKELFEYAAE